MKIFLTFFFVAFYFSLQVSKASQIYIHMGEARTKKSLLAFPALQYMGSQVTSGYQGIGNELFTTINNDLAVSSYLDRRAHV